MFQCPKCPRKFKSAPGLRIHNIRMHTDAGKTWGRSNQHLKTGLTAKSPLPDKSTHDEVRQILVSHPHGLQVKDIVAEMKRNGHRDTGNLGGFVSKICTNDPEIIRIERGIYRLKDQSTTIESKVNMQQEVVHSVPALLVRVEQLERENAALRNAHLTFVREIGA